METLPPTPPGIDLSPNLYRQLVYTLTGLLPPPIDDSLAALRARNYTAIAKVAALLPVGANEIDLAAQCIAARGQAEDMLRLIRVNANDVRLVMQLNAQYGSMVRTSLSVHGRLMRIQAVRQKREAIEGAATEDAWTAHVAEQSMLRVVEPKAERVEAARAGAETVGAPAAAADHRSDANVSKIGINSQGVAFGTLVSEQPRNRGAGGSGKTGLYSVLRTAMDRAAMIDQESAANGRESPGRVD